MASYGISEGGEQGATSSLIISCAALQPHLEALDAALKPQEGSARMGIDDGVMHGPPEQVFPAVDKFFVEISKEAGLEANHDKTKVYSPNGNYTGKPTQYKIGEITAQITGQDGNPMQITAQGLTIWGTALSKDDNYIKAVMANKGEEVCNTIKKVITPFNLLSPDVAMTVLRFSLQQRLQYFQQTHKPIHMEEINTKVQQALDSALDQVTGLKLLKSET